MDAPQELGGAEHLIGSLVTASETVKSHYGDEHLLIRHQRAEEDIALRCALGGLSRAGCYDGLAAG